MGPGSPGVTPSSAVFNSCWVWLASAVGAGFRVAIGFRGKTSKRGMGCVNACTPNSGLRGKPVGTLAYALRTNGFKPCFQSRDRKSTRLNSSHQIISYAVFCLKKKKRHQLTKSYLTNLKKTPIPNQNLRI